MSRKRESEARGRAGERGRELSARGSGSVAGHESTSGVGSDPPVSLQRITGRGLALRFQGGRPIRPDLRQLDTRSGAGRRLAQPLFKAVGVKKADSYRPRVLDATGGFGEDACLFARIGCEVVALERHPEVFALLQELVREAGDPFALRHADLLSLDPAAPPADDPAFTSPFDVVYLDPMYDAPRKTLARKPLRALRALVGPDADQDRLLAAALRWATRRVVVKRPSAAPSLAGATPVSTHRGKAVRYDVYVPGVTPTPEP